MPFDSVAEDFVEKYTTSPAGQDGGAGIGLDDRRGAKSFEIPHHRFDCLPDCGIARQVVGGMSIKRFEAIELHSIVSFCSSVNTKAYAGDTMLDGGAFGIGQVVVGGARR